MNHYYNNVEGWFTESDCNFYKSIVKNAPKKAWFVEVGSWKGRSSSCMAVEIINSGKDIRFDCVDTWQGSPEILQDRDLVANRLLDVFIENMSPVEGHYSFLVLPSVEAASLYENSSLDFVFIDGAHDFDSVYQDIKAWLPKVKIGGIIAGHDNNHEPVRNAVATVLIKSETSDNCWWHKVK